MTNNMVTYSKGQSAQVAELVDQVQQGMLTADEAATCLAGWELKNHPYKQARIDNGGLTHDNVLRQARLDIDSQLPGFTGISIDRHWPA